MSAFASAWTYSDSAAHLADRLHHEGADFAAVLAATYEWYGSLSDLADVMAR